MSRDGKPLCVVLGGGGHARVVLDCLLVSGAAQPFAVLDPNPSLWGNELLGVRILGGDDRLEELKDQGVTHFVIGLGSVGDNRPRARLFEKAASCGLQPLTARHPGSVCSAWTNLGPGSVLLAGAVVNAGANLGKNVIVNSGAIVEHDCRVGDHVHVASRACLCSTVSVGDYAHIGAGAMVRQCIQIGTGAIVAAGAAVIDDVAAWTVVGGVPARVLKRVGPRAPATRRSGSGRARA